MLSLCFTRWLVACCRLARPLSGMRCLTLKLDAALPVLAAGRPTLRLSRAGLQARYAADVDGESLTRACIPAVKFRGYTAAEVIDVGERQCRALPSGCCCRSDAYRCSWSFCRRGAAADEDEGCNRCHEQGASRMTLQLKAEC